MQGQAASWQGARPGSATTPTSGSPRPRRPARARGGRSRSWCTTRSRRSPRPRATPPTTSATRPASRAARRATPWSRSAAPSARRLATIVFEAKNKQLSKNDAWTELNACMGERDAGFAVLVVAGEDKIPSGLEELTEYQGNKIIAVLDREDPDPLGAAARLPLRARAGARRRRPRRSRSTPAAVRDAAEEAAARLKRANRVRKSLTSVTNSAETAREEFDEMVADVERCLARIEGLVAAAAETKPARAAAGRSASSGARVRPRASSGARSSPLRRPCSRPARG